MVPVRGVNRSACCCLKGARAVRTLLYTLKNHMLLIANTTTVASQTDPISPAHNAAAADDQLMTNKPRAKALLKLFLTNLTSGLQQ